MRFLRTLDVADLFRVAHPRQVSLNNRRMPRDVTYKIVKVYPMAPHAVVSVNSENPKDGFWTLGPGTPVLLPKDFDPSEDEVLRFLGVKTKKRVIAYKVTWDGKTDLSRVLTPQAVAAMKLMHAVGKSEYSARELHALFTKHYEKFQGRPYKSDAAALLLYYRRHMVNQGLLEEVVDVGPIPASVREANLQEVYRELP